MTAIEIQQKEKELIREINSDTHLLDSALRYIRKLKKIEQQAPCQYTIEELKARLRKSKASAKIGLYKTQTEMRNKISKIK